MQSRNDSLEKTAEWDRFTPKRFFVVIERRRNINTIAFKLFLCASSISYNSVPYLVGWVRLNRRPFPRGDKSCDIKFLVCKTLASTTQIPLYLLREVAARLNHLFPSRLNHYLRLLIS